MRILLALLLLCSVAFAQNIHVEGSKNVTIQGSSKRGDVDVRKLQPGETCGDGNHIKNSPGSNIEGVRIEDDGDYCITKKGGTLPYSSPQRGDQLPSGGAQPGEGIRRHNMQFIFGDYEDGPFAPTLYNTLEAFRSRGICSGEPPRCMLVTAEGVDQIQQERVTRIQRDLQGPMVRLVGPNSWPMWRKWQDTILGHLEPGDEAVAGPAGLPMWRNWFETIGWGLDPGDAFVTAEGRRWRMHKLLLDEFITAGVAVHNWGYGRRCEPRNQPIIEMQLRAFNIEDMNEFCARTNEMARSVSGRMEAHRRGRPQ